MAAPNAGPSRPPAARPSGNPNQLTSVLNNMDGLFKMARNGTMGVANANQLRTFIKKSYYSIIQTALTTSKPNPLLDIPPLLDPTTPFANFPSIVDPVAFRKAIAAAEHKVREEIKTGILKVGPPPPPTSLLGASSTASSSSSAGTPPATSSGRVSTSGQSGGSGATGGNVGGPTRQGSISSSTGGGDIISIPSGQTGQPGQSGQASQTGQNGQPSQSGPSGSVQNGQTTSRPPNLEESIKSLPANYLIPEDQIHTYMKMTPAERADYLSNALNKNRIQISLAVYNNSKRPGGTPYHQTIAENSGPPTRSAISGSAPGGTLNLSSSVSTPQYRPIETEGQRRKRKYREWMGELGPGVELEVGVDEILNQVLNTFITDVATAGVRLAKHRKSSKMEIKDLAFYLDKQYDMTVPGFDAMAPKKVHLPPEDKRRVRSVLPRAARRAANPGSAQAENASNSQPNGTE